MDIRVQQISGKAGKSIAVSDVVFGAEFNEPLIHQVVTAYMAAGRAGTHAQKTRAQVRGGGKKPWSQKGSGQARAGTIRSPLWRTGGRIFAAVPADYSQKVNKKMYRGALRSILSELVRQERLVVVNELGVDQPKTRELLGKLKTLGLSDVLIVADQADDKLQLAARNLPNVAICGAKEITPVSLLQYEKVLMTSAVVKQIEESLA